VADSILPERKNFTQGMANKTLEAEHVEMKCDTSKLSMDEGMRRFRLNLLNAFNTAHKSSLFPI